VLTAVGGLLAVGTGAGLLEPLEVQSESRQAMDWGAYLRGARLCAGALFGAAAARH
jgi:methionyl-tRNA formyltransferase